MTPEKQRIAIAEACGWKQIPKPDDDMAEAGFAYMRREWWDHRYLPEYLNDLNAMHEAEQNGVQQGIYSAILESLAFTNLHEDFALIHATAVQRAEAFLRTIGKWEDESK